MCHVGGHRQRSPAVPFLTNHTLARQHLPGGEDTEQLQSWEQEWELLDLPHDFVARNGSLSADADATRGFRRRGVGWYRKRFVLPMAWRGRCVRSSDKSPRVRDAYGHV